MKALVRYKTERNLESDVSVIFATISHYNFDSFLRCHESARIFYNILRRYGYNVSVVDGFYVHNGKKLLHSWVEFTNLLETKIIETTPQQVFPQLFAKKPSQSLVIPEDDERFPRYYPLSNDEFSEECKIENVQIDENQVRHLSEMISLAVEKLLKRKKKENR